MRFRPSMLALVAACVLTSGAAMAQIPSGNGSGEHGLGAGPDPKAMGGPATATPMAPGAAMAPDGAMAKPMMKHRMAHKRMSSRMHKKMMHHKAM